MARPARQTKRSRPRGRVRSIKQSTTQRRPVVGVVNTNDDLVMALRRGLLDEGYEVVVAHIRDIKMGRVDFGTFILSHRFAAVIYDIAIPYDDNWTFFNTLRKLPECKDQPFIVTTVNRRVLDQRVGRTDAIELVGGHADDFDPLLDAVATVVKRSTGATRKEGPTS
jgi:CheY-like chemotaxis protein